MLALLVPGLHMGAGQAVIEKTGHLPLVGVGS